jgi:hypothetical protein
MSLYSCIKLSTRHWCQLHLFKKSVYKPQEVRISRDFRTFLRATRKLFRRFCAALLRTKMFIYHLASFFSSPIVSLVFVFIVVVWEGVVAVEPKQKWVSYWRKQEQLDLIVINDYFLLEIFCLSVTNPGRLENCLPQWESNTRPFVCYMKFNALSSEVQLSLGVEQFEVCFTLQLYRTETYRISLLPEH